MTFPVRDPRLADPVPRKTLAGRPLEASLGASKHVEPKDAAWMELAIEEARAAFAEDEVPIGAVLVVGGRVVARDHNRCEQDLDPTAHAECLAIRAACRVVGAGRLDDATLYCTLEPCAMCAGAILHARLDRVVFGAHDPKFGAAGSVVDLLDGPSSAGGDGPGPKFNHRSEVVAGVLEAPCRDLLQRFFRAKRAQPPSARARARPEPMRS